MNCRKILSILKSIFRFWHSVTTKPKFQLFGNMPQILMTYLKSVSWLKYRSKLIIPRLVCRGELLAMIISDWQSSIHFQLIKLGNWLNLFKLPLFFFFAKYDLERNLLALVMGIRRSWKGITKCWILVRKQSN